MCGYFACVLLKFFGGLSIGASDRLVASEGRKSISMTKESIFYTRGWNIK